MSGTDRDESPFGTPKVKNKGIAFSSPLFTPKANVEFSKELKQVLHERNVLTTRTKKRVFDVLDEIEVTQKTEGRMRKRENAIFEIIVSEKSYVQQLSTIINFFMKPAKEKKLLSIEEYEILFGNIQTIYSVNEALLKELYKGSTKVAKAFLQIAPYFKMYSSYAMGFKRTLEFLQKARQKNPDFYEFMEKQETRPEVKSKLSALLIAPIQRIPRYKLLLQQLHEFTSPSEPDYQSICDSLFKVEEAAKHINKVVEDQENSQRLLEVQRCIKNNQPSIITPGRILLKEGILLQFDGKVGPSEKFYVVLLSDIILFCKMKSETLKPNSLKCKKIFPLNKCAVIENAEKGCFQIHCEGDDFILYDRVLSVTKEWAAELRDAIENCVEKRKTLRKESSSRKPVKRREFKEYNDIGLSPGIPLKRRRQTIEKSIQSKKRISRGRKTKESDPEDEERNDKDVSENDNEENETPKKQTEKKKSLRGKKSKNNSAETENSDNKNEEEGDSGMNDEDAEYEVDSIIDEKTIKGIHSYLIRWKGYGEESDTWEPANTLNCPEALQEFKKKKASADKHKKSGTKAKKVPEPDEEWDENEDFEVVKILDVHFKRDGKREFLVSWKGYSHKYDSWEPEENMNCKDLIEKYMKKCDQAKEADPKELRVQRKATDRFTLSSQSEARRLSKRNQGKQRVQYHEAE